VDVRDGLHGIIVWGVGGLAAGLISAVVIGGARTAADTAGEGSLVENVADSADAERDQAASREHIENPEAADETLTEHRAEVTRKPIILSSFMTAGSLLLGGVAAFSAASSGGGDHRDKGARVTFFNLRGPIRGAVVTPKLPTVRSGQAIQMKRVPSLAPFLS
jgi:hypothetical protein